MSLVIRGELVLQRSLPDVISESTLHTLKTEVGTAHTWSYGVGWECRNHSLLKNLEGRTLAKHARWCQSLSFTITWN